MLKRLCTFILKYLYGFFSCFYLFLGGFIFRSNRQLLGTICSHFGYEKKQNSVRPIIPTTDISEIITKDIPIHILKARGLGGEVSLAELVMINQLIKRFNPRRIFEFGTFMGRTTVNMAANSKKETVIFTLDLPKKNINPTILKLDDRERCFLNKEVSGERLLFQFEGGKIEALTGDSASFDFTPHFNTMDFIFIDASHSYEYVLNDSKIALKLLRSGKGVIVWHDYTVYWHGVMRALNHLYLTDIRFKKMVHIAQTDLVCLLSQ